MTNRKTKVWWYADTENTRVYKVTGYECPGNPGYWWCPEIGSSVGEGFHLFSSREDAVQRVREIAAATIERMQQRLAEMEEAR